MSTKISSSVAPLLVSATLLGVAIAFNNGAYDLRGICVLLGGISTLGWCFFCESRAEAPRESIAEGVAPGLWIALVFSLFWGWNDDGLIMYAQHSWTTGRAAMSWMAILLLTYLPTLVLKWREPKWLSWGRWSIFMVLVLIAGVDVIKTSPKPWIDVWSVQQQGADALLHGGNPYTHVAADDTTPGRSGATPYVYPPTQVLVGLIGFGFFQDVRYSMLLGVLVAAIGMRLITARSAQPLPSLVADAPSLFLLFTPKLFFILEQSWVDPVQLGFITIALTLYVYEKRLASIIMFGIAASSKQTLFLLVPLVGFMLELSLREWIIMGVAAATPVVPFMLWDFHALKHSNFDFLAHIPPRPDALTVGNWLNRKFQTDLKGTLAFPFSFAVVLLACIRGRGAAALAVALSFTYVIFFAFNKQAFANYYFFCAGLAALGAAAHLTDRRVLKSKSRAISDAAKASSAGREPTSSSA